jgi:hypothetical protein
MAEVPTPANVPTEGAAVVVSGLVKEFGDTRALDRLDLSAFEGEVHGFRARTVPARPPRSACSSAC